MVCFGSVESEVVGCLEELESRQFLSLLFLGFASFWGIRNNLYPCQEWWTGNVWGPWCSMGRERVGMFCVGGMVSRNVLELGEFFLVVDFIRVEWRTEGDGLMFFWFFIFFLVCIRESESNWVSWC